MRDGGPLLIGARAATGQPGPERWAAAAAAAREASMVTASSAAWPECGGGGNVQRLRSPQWRPTLPALYARPTHPVAPPAAALEAMERKCRDGDPNAARTIAAQPGALPMLVDALSVPGSSTDPSSIPLNAARVLFAIAAAGAAAGEPKLSEQLAFCPGALDALAAALGLGSPLAAIAAATLKHLAAAVGHLAACMTKAKDILPALQHAALGCVTAAAVLAHLAAASSHAACCVARSPDALRAVVGVLARSGPADADAADAAGALKRVLEGPGAAAAAQLAIAEGVALPALLRLVQARGAGARPAAAAAAALALHQAGAQSPPQLPGALGALAAALADECLAPAARAGAGDALAAIWASDPEWACGGLAAVLPALAAVLGSSDSTSPKVDRAAAACLAAVGCAGPACASRVCQEPGVLAAAVRALDRAAAAGDAGVIATIRELMMSIAAAGNGGKVLEALGAHLDWAV